MVETMKKDLAIDFLLFSVIGASIHDEKDTLIKACIARAYQDASSHVGYELQEKEAKVKAIFNAIEKMCNYEYNQDSFNEWHKETCREILPINGNCEYGKAQKWLNMTLKYLSVVYSVLKITEYQNPLFVKFYKTHIANYEKFFHIPIDSYICDALAWSKTAGINQDDTSLQMPSKTNSKPRKDFSEIASPYDSYIQSWSKWTEEQYATLMEPLKREHPTCDLNWETSAWIDVARCRRDIERIKAEGSATKTPKDIRKECRTDLRKLKKDAANNV